MGTLGPFGKRHRSEESIGGIDGRNSGVDKISVGIGMGIHRLGAESRRP